MDISNEYKTVDILLNEFKKQIFEEYGSEIDFKDEKTLVSVMIDRNINITTKKK